MNRSVPLNGGDANLAAAIGLMTGGRCNNWRWIWDRWLFFGAPNRIAGASEVSRYNGRARVR